MKKIFSILSVILMLTLVLGSVATAQTTPQGGGWWTGEVVQNVGTGSATVAVTAYDKATPPNTYTANATIAVGAAFTFGPLDFGSMQPGFQGSAVVSSDQPIKAIVSVTNRTANNGQLGRPDGVAIAQYQGIDSSMVANTLYFPIAKGKLFGRSTAFYIQNAGSAATSATATFKMNDGKTWTYNIASIGPNQGVAFTVLDATGWDDSLAASSPGRRGSLVVTSGGQPLAGVFMEFNTTENPGTWVASTRGFTSADFDTKAYAPSVKNNRFGHFTGMQVQNVTGAPINITVNYKGVAGACAGNTYSDTQNGIASQAMAVFNQQTPASKLPANCTASATINATGNIVATVNETVVPGFSPNSSATYFAFPAKLATAKVSAPVFKDDRFGSRVGLMIQNVGGGTATNIVSTFICRGGATFTAVSKPQTVPAGGAVLFFHPSASPAMFATPFSSANVVCAATVTGDQPVVVIAQETFTPGAFAMDDDNYEGFNVAP